VTGSEDRPEAAPAQITPVSRDLPVRAAFYGAILLAYLGAYFPDSTVPAQLGVFLFACAWSLALEHRFARPFFSSPLKIGLIILGSGIFIYFFSSRVSAGNEPVFAMISRFLFWNAIVFVLSRHKTEYDLWTLAIITLSLFMISATFVRPYGFLPSLAGATLALLYGFHRLALLRCGDPAGHGRATAAQTLLHFGLVAGLSALIFLFFPRNIFPVLETAPPEARLDEGPLSPDDAIASDRRSRSGFPPKPDQMALTDLDRLIRDTTPVLRIRMTLSGNTPYRPMRRIYLRGTILDKYEDGLWTTEPKKETRTDAKDNNPGDGWTRVADIDWSGRTLVYQHIRMRPQPGNTCFSLPDPVSIAQPRILHDERGLLFFHKASITFQEYDVVSLLPVPNDPSRLKDLNPPKMTAYLQKCLLVPGNLEQVRGIARNRRFRGGPWRRAEAFRKWLEKEYAYRLDPFVPGPGTDPVEHFLVEKRQGYCVHFASAMCLLARSSGLPARIGAGFVVPNTPEADGSVLVRNSNAHAWCEVYFEPYGWIVFDATPEARAPGELPAGEAVETPGDEDRGGEKAEKEEGEGDKRWDTFLIEYDPGSQNETFRAVWGAVASAGKFVGSVLSSLPFLIAAALLLIGLAVLYRLMPAPQRRRLRRLLRPSATPSSIEFYGDFLWILARRGIRKHPAMTGREFADALCVRLPEHGVRRLTRTFYRVKYGGAALSDDERAEMERIIRRVEESLSRPPSPS
jgi:transglutaminase-like putative cysteine protease